jgi:lipoate-protein ligase A
MTLSPRPDTNHFPPATWRLITTSPARGAWNMAVDEAILEAVGAQASQPVLRLYAWEPPCLSLGYAQPIADVDLDRLAAYGWELVRRPTGGRAILHTDELTYSVIGPLDEPRLAGSVLESYQRLAKALLHALTLLDAPAQANPNTPLPGTPKGPVCFEVPSNYEITVDGKKLIGSAQARRREGVLQHGSLPLVGDLKRITLGLKYPSESDRSAAAERLLAHATTLEAALSRPVAWESAAQAFTTAFGQALNLTFEVTQLTQAELCRADELVAEKYANPEWTNRS